MKIFDAVIIGAGASGLFCAGLAGAKGRTVLVLDLGANAGRKINISGGGRCNFTNLNTSPQNYICSNKHFVKSALAGFSPKDCISLFKSAGLGSEEKKDGQLFCKQGARAVTEFLENKARQTGKVTIKLQQKVTGVKDCSDLFKVYTCDNTFSGRSLVVASGGLAWPGLGVSDSGYKIAKQFGLKIIPCRPGLVPLKANNWPYAHLAGISLTACIGNEHKSFTDDILFTHQGLSGPAVLQISSYWHKGQTLDINFLPQLNLTEHLKKTRLTNGRIRLKNYLQTFFAKKLTAKFAHRFAHITLAEINTEQLVKITEKIHSFSFRPHTVQGFKKAEVTLGGVDTHNLCSKTMQAKNRQGLYFTGEVMDVTGQLGGYNLQWAFASAAAAARSL